MKMASDIPSVDEFRPLVLRALADGQERGRRELNEMVSTLAGLSQDQMQETLESGQLRYRNRIGWALSSFAKSGLVDRPKRGRYKITEDGKTIDRRSLHEYSETDMLEWYTWREYKEEVAQRRQIKDGHSATESEIEPAEDSVEAMRTHENAFNASIETDLRKRLQSSSPEFFERAVIELLWALGYGGTHGAKQHVGRSHDGGIDGVIRQDALGLTNVYIQAKRYADNNKVGDPDIRTFIGSLDAQGANLGVFITTSSFQDKARRTAEGYRHGKIVLIDGIRLTELMLDYGVAVQKAHQFTLYEIDDDFFEEELL
ncbi:restriction endonuclease [Brevibacterium sp. HMSC07C04]|uniref:restriction endonuclease n=1 Tax=Brevibacterium sp. HMSC07C04 TaxID=1581130 RepID=UPI000A75E8D5|nr:restriction endonuclease [Brevibacterium sp. HMSC07C04]